MSNIISAPLFFCFLTFALAGLVVSVQDAEFYLINKRDFSVKLTNYGARVVSVILPDKNGKLTDVLLGYDTTKEYENDESNFGAIVGRVANRIGGAQFTLNGTLYKLIANDGNNTLHGGPKGFSKVYWKVKKHEESYITFTYHSPDGDQGFPGDVIADVTYSIKENPYKLIVKMNAKAVNKPTPSTPTSFPPAKSCPSTAQPTIFLNRAKSIGPQMAKLPEASRGGYDINYAIDGYEDVGKRKMVAEVYDERSGIGMEIKATGAAGVQFYTANHLQGVKGKGGAVYESHGALCLETQGFPDAVNHPNFPSTIVTPEQPYRHTMHITLRVHNPRSLRVLESSDSLAV
nr:aldose 1-epimerase-like [Ipomoea batatas]